jgi:replicative superfamily II helicase
MVTGSQPVESHLHKRLIEHLNSEIVLNTILTENDAMKWLQTTFLYIRAMQNPTHYGLLLIGTDEIRGKLEGETRSRF